MYIGKSQKSSRKIRSLLLSAISCFPCSWTAKCRSSLIPSKSSNPILHRVPRSQPGRCGLFLCGNRVRRPVLRTDRWRGMRIFYFLNFSNTSRRRMWWRPEFLFGSSKCRREQFLLPGSVSKGCYVSGGLGRAGPSTVLCMGFQIADGRFHIFLSSSDWTPTNGFPLCWWRKWQKHQWGRTAYKPISQRFKSNNVEIKSRLVSRSKKKTENFLTLTCDSV